MAQPRNATLDMYFDDLRSTIILPELQVRKLIAAAQSTEQKWRSLMADGLPDQEARAVAVKIATTARNRVVEGNLRLVVKLAKRYEKHAPKEDLVAEGNLGLFTAIDRFDLSTKGRDGGFIKFTTYASWWIRHHMSRMVSEPPYTGMVHVPNYMIRLSYMTDEQLEGKAGTKVRMLMPQVRAALKCSGTLDARVTEADEPWDAIDQRAADPADEVANGERLENLADGLATLMKRANLSQREEKVVLESSQLRKTLQELSDDLGISRERVRQVKLVAIQKLRRTAQRINYNHAEPEA